MPITVAEQVESTHEAFEAGATLVHLHVRNDDQTPTSDPERFAPVLDGMRRHCPGMIMQVSTGGRSGAGRERGGMLPLGPTWPRSPPAPCNFPTRVYENAPDLVDWLAAEMKAPRRQARGRGVRPLDDLQGASSCSARADQGAAARPVRHGREERDAGRSRGVRVLRGDAEAAGARRDVDRRRHRQGPAHAEPWSLELGGHCRTGLEDNVRLDRDTLAPSNAALVQRVVELCGAFGRRPATVAEARALLKLPPPAKAPAKTPLAA